ncbi:MAG: acetylxylan esterase [Solirubrobacterales bacterium]|nr:acetylxylan esterase [Solirubrobacterales bacterium]
MKRLVVLLVTALAAGFVWSAGSASAAPSALGIPCSQAGDNSYLCGNTSPRSTATTWDGMPIDVNVALPDPGTFGSGPYPLVMIFHGYGQAKIGFGEMKRYTDEGYAVFSMSDRGFYQSCGQPDSVTADPVGCAGQYVRLMDARYEVRDAQYFAGRLADEGLVQPTKIAATGNSYGGGMSMALAALNDRTMMPDGLLVPWTSPDGKAMALAAAAPFAPWTDLAYALAPNGRTLDYLRDNRYDPDHVGVLKQSITNGLFMAGNAVGRYAPAGELPSADLEGWLNLINQGEPYQNKPEVADMIGELTNFHSSYYLDHSRAPAPTLIGAGFTDDIFPVDEAVRFYHRTRAEHSGTPIALMVADFGHQRAQNKGPELAAWSDLQLRWINWYLAHKAPKPNNEVTAWTETCPASAPSGGPYRAGDWASLAAGEITVQGGKAEQVIKPWGGSRDVANAFGVLGPGACAAPDGAREPGTANYESAPAPAAGFTVLGSPTVITDLGVTGSGSEIAARLVDVAPDGTKQLVARQLYRADRDGYQVFQLHPGAWTFAAGHVARLELLPKDGPSSAAGGTLSNYGRPSDQQQAITVRDLVLRLPVTEPAGSLRGLVKAVSPRVLPDDRGPVALARGYLGSIPMKGWTASRKTILRAVGPARAKGRTVRIHVSCITSAPKCDRSRITIRARVKGRNVTVATRGGISVAPGTSRSIALPLSGRARNLMRERRVTKRRNGRRVKIRVQGVRKLRIRVEISSGASRSTTATVLKRTGPVR